MRIAVDFLSDRELILPWNYMDWLRGLLYQAMARGIPQVASLVHDLGFSSGGKRYKLIAFSMLRPERYDSTPLGLRVKGRIRWEVTSPLDPLVEAVTLGLLMDPAVRLGRETLKIEQVRALETPPFTDRMTFVTLSPVCASTGLRDDKGVFQKRFLAPHEDDFWRVLNDNLKRKAEAVFGSASSAEVSFACTGDSRSKLLTVNDTQVRGWMMKFEAQGPVELLRVGYEAGFGERNAQGFGMVRAVARDENEG